MKRGIGFVSSPTVNKKRSKITKVPEFAPSWGGNFGVHEEHGEEVGQGQEFYGWNPAGHLYWHDGN